MSGSKIIDVVIGLSFVYLLLSLMCSALNELIASLISLRASTLKGGVKTLLDDQAFSGLAQKVYAHPLVKGLAHGMGKNPLPSYIPSDTFAAALIDILRHETAAPALPLPAPLVPAANAVLATAAPALAAAQDPHAAANLMTQLGRTLLDRTQAYPAVHKSLRALGVDHLDAENLKIQVAKWFDDSMDRVSGYYKRYSQFIVAGLAVGIALALNANSITIGRALWTDQALRTSLAQAAGDQIKQGFIKNDQATINQAANNLRTTSATVGNLDLPIGWGYQVTPELLWYEQFLGLLGTMIAVSLGAPFWFDTLNKLVNLRKAGDPPKTMDQKTLEKAKPAGTK